MIPFIQRDSDPQMPAPYEFPGVTIRSFQLEADWNALNALCDRTLNIGRFQDRGFLYRPLPLFPIVGLDVLTYPRMEDADPRYSNRGFVTQHECYFRMFVVKYISIFGLLLPVDVSIFFPYMFVDESWSLISGREVVGLPKVRARIDVPEPPNDIVVSTDVFAKYSPETKLEEKPAVTIHPMEPGEASKQQADPAHHWPWGHFDVKRLDSMHQALFPQAPGAVLSGGFSTVQLKQFRDAENDAYACYQALLRGEFTVRNVKLLSVSAPSQITIPPYDSLQIASNLGLLSAGPPVYEPMLEYKVTCDMRYGNVITEYASGP